MLIPTSSTSLLQADIVKGFEEMREEIQKLLEKALPELENASVVELHAVGEYTNQCNKRYITCVVR